MAGFRPKLTCDSLSATRAERKRKKQNTTEHVVVCDCWARAEGNQKRRECQTLQNYGPASFFKKLRPGHGRPRPAMAGHGRPWQAMAGHGRPWQAMAGHGRPWPAMGGHGRPWAAMAGMADHGQPWPAMGGHGRPWPAMAGHGRPWARCDLYREHSTITQPTN